MKGVGREHDKSLVVGGSGEGCEQGEMVLIIPCFALKFQKIQTFKDLSFFYYVCCYVVKCIWYLWGRSCVSRV